MKFEVLTDKQKSLVSGLRLVKRGECADFYAMLSDLTDRLAAAERIVDHAIAHASYAGTRIQAQEYRSRFPKASGLEVETDG